MKVFLDTNFIMDLLIREEEYRLTPLQILETSNRKKIQFYLSFLSVANFAYITRKQDKKNLFENINRIIRLFNVLPNNRNQLVEAMKLDADDFEDTLQYVAAIEGGCDCIITRNKKDFKFSKIPLYTPSEFLNLLSQK